MIIIFIIKDLAEELKNNLNVQEKTLKNRQPLQFQQLKKLQKLIKMEKKLQKNISHITVY